MISSSTPASHPCISTKSAFMFSGLCAFLSMHLLMYLFTNALYFACSSFGTSWASRIGTTAFHHASDILPNVPFHDPYIRCTTGFATSAM